MTKPAINLLSYSKAEPKSRQGLPNPYKINEDGIRESEQIHHIAFDLSPHGMTKVGIDRRFLRVNEKYCQITGYSADELLSMSISDLNHPDDNMRDVKAFTEYVNGDAEFLEIEKRYMRKDGKFCWVVVNARMVRDASGNPMYSFAVIQDISERKKAEQELKETDRRKNEFLAILSHELRNPLAPVRNGLHVMRTSFDREKSASIMEMMERQLTQMVRLIDDLLDISRIEQGRLELRKENITLQSAIQSAIEASTPFIESRKHTLTIDISDEILWLNADLTRVAQVIGNLLNNAVKYTPEGGNIAISAHRENMKAVIFVVDNGIGISADMMPKIFELFTQADSGPERKQRGLGIGLALARQIIEMHYGTIIAHSDGLNKGSTFAIRLPLVFHTTAEDRAIETFDNKLLPDKPLRILIIDDNIPSAETLGMLMKMAGHEYSLAYDGIEAFKIALEIKPDVILSDIGLPGMNGYDLCRKLKKDRLFKNTIFIAQTGWGQECDRQMAYDAGFDHHFVKPVDPNELIGLFR